MRNLLSKELHHVSAAAGIVNCVSTETWAEAHKKAKKDAAVLSLFGGALSGGIVGSFNGYWGAYTAALTMPYIFTYAYFDSNAWKFVYSY